MWERGWLHKTQPLLVGRHSETWAAPESHYFLRIHFFPLTSVTSHVFAPDNPVENEMQYLKGIHLPIIIGNTITCVSLSMFLNLRNLKNCNKLPGRELLFGFYVCSSTEKNYVTSSLRVEIWDRVAESVTVSRTEIFNPVKGHIEVLMAMTHGKSHNKFGGQTVTQIRACHYRRLQ